MCNNFIYLTVFLVPIVFIQALRTSDRKLAESKEKELQDLLIQSNHQLQQIKNYEKYLLKGMPARKPESSISSRRRNHYLPSSVKPVGNSRRRDRNRNGHIDWGNNNIIEEYTPEYDENLLPYDNTDSQAMSQPDAEYEGSGTALYTPDPILYDTYHDDEDILDENLPEASAEPRITTNSIAVQDFLSDKPTANHTFIDEDEGLSDDDFIEDYEDLDGIEEDQASETNNKNNNDNNDDDYTSYPDEQYDYYEDQDYYSDNEKYEQYRKQQQEQLKKERRKQKKNLRDCLANNGIMANRTFTVVILVPSEAKTQFKYSWRFIRPAVEVAKVEAEQYINEFNPSILKHFVIKTRVIYTKKEEASSLITNMVSYKNIQQQHIEETGDSTFSFIQFIFRYINSQSKNIDIDSHRPVCNPPLYHKVAGVIGPVSSKAASELARLMTDFNVLHITPGLLSEYHMRNRREQHKFTVRTGPVGAAYGEAVVKFLSSQSWRNQTSLMFRRIDRHHTPVHQPVGDAILYYNRHLADSSNEKIKKIGQLDLNTCMKIITKELPTSINNIKSTVSEANLDGDCVVEKLKMKARIIVVLLDPSTFFDLVEKLFRRGFFDSGEYIFLVVDAKGFFGTLVERLHTIQKELRCELLTNLPSHPRLQRHHRRHKTPPKLRILRPQPQRPKTLPKLQPIPQKTLPQHNLPPPRNLPQRNLIQNLGKQSQKHARLH